ncbi:MAG: hypothetical protein GXP55_26595, partial [Deltaproteobacteria bacterium]|nr:hypothetical protein [Deltaproteobacteria bacterium]
MPAKASKSRWSAVGFISGPYHEDLASDRLSDNPNEALKGRQVSSETFDASGVVLSSDHASFVVRRLAVGLTGVTVSYAYVSQSDSFRYDNAPFEPLDAPLELPAVARQDLAPAGSPPLPPDSMETLYIAGARYAHIRSLTPDVDNVGNVLEQTALGRLRGEFGARDGALPDESITTHTTPLNLTASPSGWLWRTEGTFVTGHGSAVRLGDTTSEYNDVGDLLRSLVHVSQVQARAAGDPWAGVERLPEFAGDGSAAGLPSREEDVTSSSAFDSWGNASTTCGGDVRDASVPCLRRSDVTYDSDYAQFPEVETVDVSPGAADSLSYRAVWDRGYSVITSATDPNGFVTRATYDGLSRPTSSTPPDGAGCDGARRPLTRIHYHLAGQRSESEPFAPGSHPLSRVVTTTELACAASSLGADTSTLTSIRYADGLGRVRAQLDTGDEEAGHLWVKTAVVTLDKKGTTRRSYQPSFFGASADDYSAVVSLPSVPSVTARYDAFGRARASVNEDGSATWTSYHALSTDVCDPNDLDASSPHYRTCTTTRTDGHGRTIDLIQRNRQADRPGLETYRLWTDYRADNAVLRVRRLQTSNDAPRGSSVVLGGRVVERQLFYDTVARRIAATDPDTDSRTEPNPERRTWRYLFNRVGDLAGVRDPRGCGQNFYYDHAGRLIGEAYVSCGEAEAQETPNPESAVPAGAVGFGLLASAASVDRLLSFDTYPAWTLPSGGLPTLAEFRELPADARAALGRATAMMDRGQRCAYAYDERGNLLWEGRELAVVPEALPDADALPDVGTGPFDPQPPAGSALATVQYDEAHVYERSLAYDHANRPTAVVLPRDPDFDSGAMGGGLGPRIGGTLFYNRRGLPGRMDVRIADGGAAAPVHTPDALTNGGLELPGATLTAYPIVQHIDYLRDALVGRVVYGDGRSPEAFGPPLPGPDTRPDRTATESTTAYDIRRRPFRMRTQREPTSPPGSAGTRPLAEVSQVVDQRLAWDVANNLIALLDDRDANEWPLGHRPQSVHIAHD